MKWNDKELKILKQYATTDKTMADVHNDLVASGFDRTFKAVTRKIESMRLSKPFKKVDVAALPKILILDIETTPIAVWTWSLGNQYINPTSIIKDSNGKYVDWYVLSWSAKWLYDNNVLSDVVTPEEARARDDKRIMMSIWKLLDQADIVIAHNGDKFDLRKLKARFISNAMVPPMPYKTIDTLKVARKEFAFSSNKQDYITKFLGLEEKLDTDFQLWVDCMNGNVEALERMEKYNRTDVVGLEEMYLKLRPYIKNHPNLAVMMDDNVCSVCGSHSLVDTGKYYHTGASRYELFCCESCMSPHIRGKSSVLDKNINVRSTS